MKGAPFFDTDVFHAFGLASTCFGKAFDLLLILLLASEYSSLSTPKDNVILSSLEMKSKHRTFEHS